MAKVNKKGVYVPSPIRINQAKIKLLRLATKKTKKGVHLIPKNKIGIKLWGEYDLLLNYAKFSMFDFMLIDED
jgi:hypothetical protein